MKKKKKKKKDKKRKKKKKRLKKKKNVRRRIIRTGMYMNVGMACDDMKEDSIGGGGWNLDNLSFSAIKTIRLFQSLWGFLITPILSTSLSSSQIRFSFVLATALSR